MPQVDVEIPAHEWRLRNEGVAAASVLAERLREADYRPTKIVASLEPKATQTGSVMAERLRLPFATAEGLHEHDRRASGFLSTNVFAARMRDLDHLLDRHDRAEHVGHVGQRHDLGPRRQESLELVDQEFARIRDRRPLEHGALPLAMEMPGHDVRVVLHDRKHDLVAFADLDRAECQRLLDRALQGTITSDEAEAFRAQLLTEMARMSVDDGLVMQIHPGSFRNHNPTVFGKFGRDKGADIPMRTDYVHALKPLLDDVGNAPGLTLILFTLDETTYARELAPLAGHYPALKLGPPWWFHDSFQGMLRFLEQTIETAGFANTAGFNDDTRAFMSIPARHDVWRRVACRFLATCVVEHRFGEDEAYELAPMLARDLAKAAYRL